MLEHRWMQRLAKGGADMLAALPRRQVTALYPSVGVMVPGGPATPSALRRELVAVRARGHALEVGSVSAGLSSVASAVLDRDGHPVAAVATTFRAEEVDDATRDALASATRRAAEAIGSRL